MAAIGRVLAAIGRVLEAIGRVLAAIGRVLAVGSDRARVGSDRARVRTADRREFASIVRGVVSIALFGSVGDPPLASRLPNFFLSSKRRNAASNRLCPFIRGLHSGKSRNGVARIKGSRA